MTPILPRIRPKIALKLFLTHFLAVLLVSGSIGTFFYLNAANSLMASVRSRLQNSAALISQSIDARDLDAIRSPEDATTPIYIDTLDRLRQLRQSNPDLAFLYIMRKQGDTISFVVDSDESGRQAQPGREYTEWPDILVKGFFAPAVDDKPYQDEWGSFLSGYAPLKNGQGTYLIGIDMRADEVSEKLQAIRTAGIVSLQAALLLALFFALYLSAGLTTRLNDLVERCRQIADGKFEASLPARSFDEFDTLIDAFNRMSGRLSTAHQETQKAMEALQDARDTLEVRVQERTRSLEAALENVQVLSGLLPICASCKKIRDDQGYWQQVEQFVATHTGARFSHGLCPDCVLSLYGDILAKHNPSPPEKEEDV
ncbi:HAMP domain-containing protein [Desulfosarcina sp. OttesenSCG-928-B08]|nr:HAMP domain-containing protein [Desulfosarcina sp. OttesenSCG-928-B08]